MQDYRRFGTGVRSFGSIAALPTLHGPHAGSPSCRQHEQSRDRDEDIPSLAHLRLAAGLPAGLAAPRRHRRPDRLRHPRAGRHGLRGAGRRAPGVRVLRSPGRAARLRGAGQLPPTGGGGVLCHRHHVGGHHLRAGHRGQCRVHRPDRRACHPGGPDLHRGRGASKLGRIAQFFSESVLVGFVFGLALLISIKQVPKLLGIEAEGESALDLLRDIIPQVAETDLLTLAVGLAGIGGMLLLEHRLPRVPAALVVLLASIVASVVLGLEAAGVHVVGDLPAGLAPPSLPGVGLDALPLLLVGAVGIALVAFAEAVGPANEFARRHGDHIDPNRELVAIGAANTSAGLFSGFPIGSSLSKSAANDNAGARTPASLVTAAAATALVALFLTADLRTPARGHPGGHRHRGRHGHDEGRQDAPAVGAAAGRLLAGHDRARGRPGRAHPAGAGHRRRRLAGRPHLARQRAAPDLPGPGQRRAGAARPANGPGVGRTGPGHRAPGRDALLRQCRLDP